VAPDRAEAGRRRRDRHGGRYGRRPAAAVAGWRRTPGRRGGDHDAERGRRSLEPDDKPAPTIIKGAGTVRPSVTPLCRSSDIAITIIAQSDDPTAAGTQRALIAIVNNSPRACRVDGRVHVRLYNAADEQLPIPTKNVDEPGEATDMILRSGGGAFQGMKWQTCNRDQDGCPAGNTFRGSLESSGAGVVAQQEGFPAEVESRITMSSLQLGTLQPSPEGVVAW
jgi:hypothetical protein